MSHPGCVVLCCVVLCCVVLYTIIRIVKVSQTQVVVYYFIYKVYLRGDYMFRPSFLDRHQVICLTLRTKTRSR